MLMNDIAHAVVFKKTLKLKIMPECYSWLNKAATEVNAIWNYCNETAFHAIRRADPLKKWMSGFDLCYLTAGSTEYFEHIGADTIQRICIEFANKRNATKKSKLRWRVSRGTRRSLGWIPFKAASIKRRGKYVRFCKKTFRVFAHERLDVLQWRDGCFAQDALGDWWLCLPHDVATTQDIAPREAVGIDLGLKDTAVTSDGEKLESGRFYRNIEHKIAAAQRRGHKRQAKRWHRKAKNKRLDNLHKFSRKIVDSYQKIVIGDVSSTKLVKTNMAKSVLDSGWGMLKRFLQYKGEHAGRTVEIVSEMYTTQACSNCGCLSGPKGLRQLDVRQWDCVECGVTHDRDINSALNILRRAEVAGVRQRERVAAKSAVLPDTSSLQDMDRHKLVAA